MTLEEYLIEQGMTPEFAAEMWQNYRSLPSEAFWQNLPDEKRGMMQLFVRDWIQHAAETGPIVLDVGRQELVGVRAGCIYRVVHTQPMGRAWMVMLQSLPFPIPMAERPGLPQAEPAAVVAGEVDEGGNLAWMTLTPMAKEVFGDLLINAGIDWNTWVWIQEFDLWRGEKLPQAEGPEVVVVPEGSETETPPDDDPMETPTGMEPPTIPL